MTGGTFAKRATRGAIAGAGATVVMSVVMVVAERVGLMGTHPPERIVQRAMVAGGQPASPRAVEAAATAAHVAFGTAAGAAFGTLAGSRSPVIAQRFAMAWALAIWMVSYVGWIPALGILPPPSEDRPGRAWTMLAAHAVYGGMLGVLWRVLSRG